MTDKLAHVEVWIDPSRCTAAGVCMAVAPLSFEVGPDHITVGVNPFGDDMKAVTRAIEECPMQAISLRDVGKTAEKSSGIRKKGARTAADKGVAHE